MLKVHIFLASNFGIVMRGFRCCGILKSKQDFVPVAPTEKEFKKKLIWTMLSVNYLYKSKQNRIPTSVLSFLPTNSTLRLIRLEWPRFQHAHSLLIIILGFCFDYNGLWTTIDEVTLYMGCKYGPFDVQRNHISNTRGKYAHNSSVE